MGAPCPLVSLVLKACVVLTGDRPQRLIPFGRLLSRSLPSRPMRLSSHYRQVNPMRQPSTLPQISPHAAGVDIGAHSHFAAVPPGSDPKGQDVR